MNESETPCGLKIKPSQAHCMLLLLEASREGKVFSQQNLSERVGINKSNIARLSARMLSDGLIIQKTNESDGRQFDISLTAKGLKMAEKIEVQSLQRFQDLLKNIPSEDEQGVLKALQILNAAILKL